MEKNDIEVVEMNPADEKPDDSSVEIYEVNEEKATETKRPTSRRPARKAKASHGSHQKAASAGPGKHHAPSVKPSKKEDAPNLLVGLIIFAVLIGIVLVFYWDTFFPAAPSGPASVGGNDTVWATVNGKDITKSEILNAYSRLQPRYGAALTLESVLNQTISRMLLVEEAQRRGVSVSDADVEKAYADLVATLPPGTSMESVLAAQHVSVEDAKKELKDQLFLEGLFKDFVSDKDIQAYYDANSDRFKAKEGQIRARHILVDTKEEADAIEKQLAEGSDFAFLASQKSKDTASGARGGDLGFFGDGVMVKNFSDVAFSLKVGEISDPVQTKFGYHIIQRESDTVPLEEVKDIISQTLLVQQLPPLIADLRNAADIQIFYVPTPLVKEDVTDTLPPQDLQVDNASEQNGTAELALPGDTQDEAPADAVGLAGFEKTGKELCADGGKPIVRMYSTTTCPHCNWVGDTFDAVVAEYDGRIDAAHWVLDSKDNSLTGKVETAVPQEEIDRFLAFNPDATVPTFIIGCEYTRVGNHFESSDDLASEKQGFRNVIDAVLA
ncbi:MAG: hypothetical protein GXP63_05575 [DPANN group archaeon]|nr:hypothetical protein [DPANN group archaeon]